MTIISISSKMEGQDMEKILSPIQIVTPNTWEEYKHVCTKVFIEEQNISPEATFDVYDEQPSTLHFVIPNQNPESNGEIVGVCRIRLCGPYVVLGRLAVLKDHRGSGLGETLTLAALKYSKSEFPTHTVMVHAQVQTIDFYSRLGFLVVSEEFINEVNLTHRTMFYPNTNRENLLETHSFPDKKTAFDGDCYDPKVMERMKKMMSSSFVPLSSLVSCITNDVGRCRRQFVEVAYSIQNEQAKLYPELFDLGFKPKCLPLSEAKLGLEELLMEGWGSLNCGFIPIVPDYWLSFYSAVKLIEAVLLETEQKLQECLTAVDNGILMGRQESLPGSRMLSGYAARIHRKIPEVEMDWNLKPTVAIDPPHKINADSTALWIIKEVQSLSDDSVSDSLSSGLPFIIRGGAKEWKAMEKWSFPSLTRLAGYRTVPVDIGRRYVDEDWMQRRITVQQFVGQYLLATEVDKPGCITEHRVLDQIPQLLEDVDTTVITPFAANVEWNAHIGTSGFTSGIHRISKSNFFVQIVGEQFIRLAHERDTEDLYPRDDDMKNASHVDIESPDLDNFPNFQKVHFEDVVLYPGDILYIPKEFWHFVKSLTPSMAVSALFDQE